MTITLNGTTGITTPAVTNNGAYTGDGISFADATPSNTLVTDTSGNVGIGTSSPSYKLDIVGSAARISNAGTANFATRNSTAGINWEWGVDGSGNGFVYTGQSSSLVFSNSATERMRITSSGGVGIGTNSPTGMFHVYGAGAISTFTQTTAGNYCITSNPYNNANIYYHCAFNIGGTGVGSITSSGSSTTFATSSDYRLKENVVPMTGALATVSALKPVTYTWKVDGSNGQGFIAHELQEIVPECVTGKKDAVDEDGKPIYQGIDTSFLVATLTAAIQELKAELDTVKTELATLKGTA